MKASELRRSERSVPRVAANEEARARRHDAAGVTGATPRSRLMRYLAIGYTLLIAYASLYPFDGWQPAPGAWFDFVPAPWPRYYTWSDVGLNLLAYVPLGFFSALAALARFGALAAAVLATGLGAALSLFMEFLQQFTASRVASNLDLLSNALGALAGVLLAVTLGRRWVLGGRLYQARQRLFVQARMTDLGFVLLLLWLFTQLKPQIWLFGNGESHWLLSMPEIGVFDPSLHRWLEAAVTAVNLAGVCLLMKAMARPREPVAGLLLAIVSVALGLKAVGTLTLFRHGDAALWLTPGAVLGIPAGILLYFIAAQLPRRGVAATSATLLVLGAVLVNLAPENPYIADAIRTWRHGHFLSFNGLTRLASMLWPLLASAYLCALVILARTAHRPTRGLR